MGTTTSKLPGRIITIDQSEIPSRSQVQFITLFFRGARLCCAFYQPRQSGRIWGQNNQFPELNRHIWLFRNKFYCLESQTEHRWRCSNNKQYLPLEPGDQGKKGSDTLECQRQGILLGIHSCCLPWSSIYVKKVGAFQTLVKVTSLLFPFLIRKKRKQTNSHQPAFA